MKLPDALALQATWSSHHTVLCSWLTVHALYFPSLRPSGWHLGQS